VSGRLATIDPSGTFRNQYVSVIDDTNDFDESVDVEDQEYGEDEIRVARRIQDLDTAARWLRIAAILMAVIWLVGVVSLLWTNWEQASRLNAGPTFGDQGINSFGDTFTTFRQVLATVTTGTWGYLALAVATYVTSLILAMRYEDALTRFVSDDPSARTPPPA